LSSMEKLVKREYDPIAKSVRTFDKLPSG